jgi:hypothetical protein
MRSWSVVCALSMVSCLAEEDGRGDSGTTLADGAGPAPGAGADVPERESLCFRVDDEVEQCLGPEHFEASRRVDSGVVALYLTWSEATEGLWCCERFPKRRFQMRLEVPEGAAIPYSGDNGSLQGEERTPACTSRGTCATDTVDFSQDETVSIDVTALAPEEAAGTASASYQVYIEGYPDRGESRLEARRLTVRFRARL